MLQHNISRNSTLINDINLTIDTKDLQYKDGNYGNFNIENINSVLFYEFDEEIDRINKITIEEIILPDINDDNKNIIELKQKVSWDVTMISNTNSVNIIRSFMEPVEFVPNSDEKTTFIDAMERYTEFNPISKYNEFQYRLYDVCEVLLDLIPGKVILRLTGPNSTEPLREEFEKFYMRLTTLTYHLGYRTNVPFKTGYISEELSEVANIIIDESNNKLFMTVIDHNDKLRNMQETVDIVITIPYATYDIYTLSRQLSKNGITFIYNSISKKAIFIYEPSNETVKIEGKLPRHFSTYTLNGSPLQNILGLENVRNHSFISIPDTSYNEEAFLSTLFRKYRNNYIENVNYNYELPTNLYTIDTIINALNDYEGNDPYTYKYDDNGILYPKIEFSYDNLRNRVIASSKKYSDFIGSEQNSLLRHSALLYILGSDTLLNSWLGIEVQQDPIETYIFPNAPRINTQYYNLHSSVITNITKFKPQIINYFDNIIANTLSATTEIYLSKKSKLKKIDLFITNDKGDIYDLFKNRIIIKLKIHRS